MKWMTWDASLHPRDRTGKFTEKGGSLVPTDHVASVFDLEGFTSLTETQGDAFTHELIQEFTPVIARQVEANGGRMGPDMGDAVTAVFPDADSATRAALDAQQDVIRLRAEKAGEFGTGWGLRVAVVGQLERGLNINDLAPGSGDFSFADLFLFKRGDRTQKQGEIDRVIVDAEVSQNISPSLRDRIGGIAKAYTRRVGKFSADKLAKAAALHKRFDPDQPRDKMGRWTLGFAGQQLKAVGNAVIEEHVEHGYGDEYDPYGPSGKFDVNYGNHVRPDGVMRGVEIDERTRQAKDPEAVRWHSGVDLTKAQAEAVAAVQDQIAAIVKQHEAESLKYGNTPRLRFRFEDGKIFVRNYDYADRWPEQMIVRKSTMTTGDLGDAVSRQPTRGGNFAGARAQGRKKKIKIRRPDAAVEKQERLVKSLIEDDGYGTPLIKSNEELRYTLGLFYAPDMDDLHKEWASDDELHRGVIRYQLQGDRRLRKQHNTLQEVGTVLSVFRWPYPTEAVMKSATTGIERKITLPAGSVFAEVLWDEDAWPDVKAGKIRGYSMGGRAMRVRLDP